MIPFALPVFTDDCKQSPQYRKRTNRFTLVFFALTALIGLAIKYVPS